MIWLDRGVIRLSLAYCLCIDEKSYHKELTRMKVHRDMWPFFVSDGKDGTTHFFHANDQMDHCAIVCVRMRKSMPTGIEIAGLLVHEAVHIWQEHIFIQGERNPSKEYEAYSIQTISQELMWAYRDLTKERPCPSK